MLFTSSQNRIINFCFNLGRKCKIVCRFYNMLGWVVSRHSSFDSRLRFEIPHFAYILLGKLVHHCAMLLHTSICATSRWQFHSCSSTAISISDPNSRLTLRPTSMIINNYISVLLKQNQDSLKLFHLHRFQKNLQFFRLPFIKTRLITIQSTNYSLN